MVEDRIGYRYAKSAFSLAQEHNELEAAKADMQMLHDLFAQSAEFRSMLQSPIIQGAKKQAVLDLIFKGKFETKVVEHLIRIIVSKGREPFLQNVASAFLDMYDEATGVLRGVLTSAVALPAATIAQIKASMESTTGKTFEMTTEVNPELIGGFTLKVGDSLFDGSMSSSLRRLKQELT
ncbi:MAG: ATP synthase F1 subunit delta [Bacteroidia bacterium]|nr:ATP synthase F1 subunit delta [Bacteroidia bacterium]